QMVRWLPRTTCTSTSRSPTAKARRAISPGSSPGRLPSAVMVTRTAATPHARSRSTLAVQRTAGWLRYANSSLLVHSRKPPRSRSRWASGVGIEEVVIDVRLLTNCAEHQLRWPSAWCVNYKCDSELAWRDGQLGNQGRERSGECHIGDTGSRQLCVTDHGRGRGAPYV